MKNAIRLPLLSLTLLASPGFGALTDGLVSYWPLDVADGGITTPDLSFTNTLTITGLPTVGSGQFSNAFTFDGSSTWLISLHSNDNRDTGLPIYGAGSYSVCFWVKGAAQTARYIFTEGNATNNNPILAIQSGNAAANNAKLDVLLRNIRGQALINHIVSSNVVFDNNWHHVAFVDDRGQAKLYLDGVLDGTSTNGNWNYVYSYGDVPLNTTAIGNLTRLAAPAAANTFNGQIDEVATWERPLSASEINQVRTTGVYTPGSAVPARAVALGLVPADTLKQQGEWHLLSVDPTGNRPLAYQWSKNGAPITDATNRYYLVVNLQTNNSGDFYSCAVTNPGGFAISSNAILTVAADLPPSLTNGLVDYWPLDFFSLEDTNLISPELHFGHKLVLRNLDTNSQVVAGQFSNAIFCIASLPTFGMRSNGTAIYSQTNYSVSLWVKGDGTTQADRRVFSEGRDGANNNPLFTLGTDNAPAGFAATASAYPFVRTDAGANAPIVGRLSTRPVFDNNWHHIVWTDAKGQAKLYVDGNLDETDYRYNRPTNITLNLTMIGVTARTTAANVPAPVTPYTGNIDEVATWNRVLSWSEIQQIMTNGIPVPEGIVGPSLVTAPSDRTNNVFVGDTVTFTVIANGTFPLGYQWRKNGSPISGAINASALTDTLSLTNVQLADSNTTYSVTVSNAASSFTTTPVRLYVTPWTPATNGVVLQADIDLTTLPDTQPGFLPLVLGANPANFPSAVKVTLAGIGTSLAERHRSSADVRYVISNPPAMTQAQLYNDFVFANDSAIDGTGLSILIERLGPGVKYGLTLWSFDPVSSSGRVSDWIETASGTPVPITNGYTFDGLNVPTNNYQYTLGGLLTASPDGKLQIEGRRNGGTSFGVFLNAIRLVAKAAGTRITDTAVVGGNLRIRVESDYPGQPVSLEQNPALGAGVWTSAAGAVLVDAYGPVSVFEVPVSASTMFFRVSSYLP
ncbi:MAG TPA: LamG-like jellyroll fold domain-containing protein [Methylomirabilota bacterium]|nr:LamG-like jellyroll fold domain-containing protein [Methylomirabilota bacterium]